MTAANAAKSGLRSSVPISRPPKRSRWSRLELPYAPSLKMTVTVLMPNCTAVASSVAANRKPPSPLTATTGRSGAATLAPNAIGERRTEATHVRRRQVAARLVDREVHVAHVADGGGADGEDRVIGNAAPQFFDHVCLRADGPKLVRDDGAYGLRFGSRATGEGNPSRAACRATPGSWPWRRRRLGATRSRACRSLRDRCRCGSASGWQRCPWPGSECRWQGSRRRRR